MKGYKITEILHRNERVAVYRAVRESDGRKVVLKTLVSGFPSIRDITRLRMEYELSRGLEITGLVPILSFDKDGSTPFLVLDDINGLPLNDFNKYFDRNILSILIIFKKITEVVGELHRNGILHKDLKPENILFQRNSFNIFLIDLGLASRYQLEEEIPLQTGVLEGTLSYISPEQTGRMNRRIDHRSDLYSLGVIFYELSTGKLPFESKEPLELIHSHIAKQPIPPIELKPDLPPSISQMILKLLSKNAEDRYKSADGLIEDLNLCITLLESNRDINFLPGEKESKGKFFIPQKLYGREAELSYLLSAFEQIAESPFKKVSDGSGEIYGGVKVALIGGYSGIGKTALIRELEKPILERRGFFISGKFEQYKRNIPYYPLVEALSIFVRHILTEKDERLRKWKKKIEEACGKNISLIVELIPDLKHLFKKYESPEDLSLGEAEERFQLTLERFISCLPSQENPVVLFLDDLQWADTPTLKFIERTTRSREIHHLLLLGTYREKEIDSLHPLNLILESLKKDNIPILKIHLAPLPEYFVERMISETILTDSCGELSDLVYRKTAGNPFFTRHFLNVLFKDNLIYFDKSNKWIYNIKEIENKDYGENVIDILTENILKLKLESLEIIKIAACVGNQFSLGILSNVLQKSPHDIAILLKDSIIAGYILPNSELYRSAEVLEDDFKQITDTSHKIVYKFIHDRVQQAAYTLLEDDDRKELHLKIGRKLLETEKHVEIGENLYEIVNQFNLGKEKVKDEGEREYLIQLNYMAGKRALDSYSYENALGYFNQCYDYPEALNLFSQKFNLSYEKLQCMYKLGMVKETSLEIDNLFPFTQTKFEKSLAYNLKVQCQTNLGEYEKSVQTCIESLKLFDIELKLNISSGDLFMHYKKVIKKLKDKDIYSLLDSPPMQNREVQIIMEILMNGALSAFWNLPNYGTLFSILMTDYTLDYGNHYTSSFSYSSFGIFLCSIGEYKKGYEFGELSIKLYEKYPSSTTAIKVLHNFGCFIKNWKSHSKFSVELLMKSFEKFSYLKDVLYNSTSITNSLLMSYVLGKDLNNVLVYFSPYLSYVEKYFKDSYYACNYIIDFINLLRAERFGSETLSLLSKIKLDDYSPNYDTELKVGIYVYYVNKSYLDFIFKEYVSSYQNYLQAKELRIFGLGMLYFSHDYFISALTLIKHIKLNNLEDIEKKREIEIYIKQFKIWSESNPENYKHKYYLILAERARLRGDYWDAAGYYEVAIESAIENEFNLDAGLCAELSAEFYLESSRYSLAKRCLEISLYYYETSGALAKVYHLREQYNDLTLGFQIEISRKKDSISNSITKDYSKNSIDITSVLRATTALSEERNREVLLSKLMRILVENAGATKTILLEISDSEMNVEAEFSTDRDEVEFFVNTGISDLNLPSSLLNYIKRTGDSILIQDIHSDERWKNETYYMFKKYVSVLSFPILHQGTMTGILYLENTNSTHVFTMERMNVLQMISSQAAISLENARLYQSMEEKIQARTRELEEKNKSIEELNIFIKTINESSDLDYILDKIHSHIKKNFQIQHFGLGIAEENSNYAKTVYLTYPEDESTRKLIHSTPIPVRGTKGAHSLAFDSNKAFYVKRIRLDRIPPEERYVVETFGLKSILILPLILKGVNIGYFDLFNGRDELSITKEQISQLSILAEQLAGIIYSSNLYREIQVKKKELEATLEELRTTQKQLVEAERSAALGQLISGVAHEINNPLAAIRSSTEVLEMDQKKFLDEVPLFIKNSSMEILVLLQELLKKSDRNRKILTSREERQRKKKVRESLDTFFFSSPTSREGISELLAELFLEEDYPEIQSTFNEDERIKFLKIISLFSTQKQALGNIKLSTEKSSRVIFSLRKYLKTEIRATAREVSLSDLIDNSLNVYGNYIRGIITVENKIEKDIKLFCVVDEIQEVLKNLVFNAVQSMYLEKTKILTFISEIEKKPEQRILHFSIQDSGTGIAPENRERLFSPFFTTKARGEGIGLGLYVSQQIIIEHGGTIEYEAMEIGSKFKIKIPL